MPDDKDVALTIRMTATMRVQLEELATETDQSVAQLIREAVREWFEIPEPERIKIMRNHRKTRRAEA